MKKHSLLGVILSFTLCVAMLLVAPMGVMASAAQAELPSGTINIEYTKEDCMSSFDWQPPAAGVVTFVVEFTEQPLGFGGKCNLSFGGVFVEDTNADGKYYLTIEVDGIDSIPVEATYPGWPAEVGNKLVVSYKYESVKEITYPDLPVGDSTINPGDKYQYTAGKQGTLEIYYDGGVIIGTGGGQITMQLKNNDASLVTLDCKMGVPNVIKMDMQPGDVAIISGIAGYIDVVNSFVTEGSEKPLPDKEFEVGSTAMHNATNVPVEYKYTAASDGILKIDFRGLVNGTNGRVEMYIHGDKSTLVGMDCNAGAPASIELPMKANDVAFITFKNADIACYSEFVTAEGGPDGTVGNPFVVNAIPTELSGHTDTNGIYYIFNVPSDGILVINGNEGALVSFEQSQNEAEVAADGSYRLHMVKGEQVLFRVAADAELDYNLKLTWVEEEFEELNSIDKIQFKLGSGDKAAYQWHATEDGTLVFNLTGSSMPFGYGVSIQLGQKAYDLYTSEPVELEVKKGDKIVIKAVTYASTEGGTIDITGAFKQNEAVVGTEEKPEVLGSIAHVDVTVAGGEYFYNWTAEKTGKLIIKTNGDGTQKLAVWLNNDKSVQYTNWDGENKGEYVVLNVTEGDVLTMKASFENLGEGSMVLEGTYDDEGVNPPTGDNIYAVALMGLVAMFGVAVVASKKKAF